VKIINGVIISEALQPSLAD